MNKVVKPNHYNKGIEVLQFIDSWELDFTIGNVVKYVTRAPYKGTEIEDLEKAKYYLERRLEKLKTCTKHDDSVD